MVRTRVRWARVLALATLLVLGVTTGVRALAPDVAPETRPYVVVEGDTLWSIARSTVGPEGDPRPAVDLLRSLNRVDPAALRPGATILLPAG